MNGSDIEIIAHRGYSAQAPENTLPAFRKALAVGAPALEWDIMATRGGVPVVFHDDRVDRTTDGEGLLEKHTWGELAELDAGSWWSEEFRGTRVPRLREVLELVEGTDVKLYPELKPGASPELVETTVKMLQEAGLLAQSTLLSFDHDVVDQALGLAPDLSGGYNVDTERDLQYALERAFRRPRVLVDAEVGVWLEHPELTRRARDLKVEVACYTADDPDQVRALLDLGLTRLISNEVEQTRNVVRQWQARQE